MLRVSFYPLWYAQILEVGVLIIARMYRKGHSNVIDSGNTMLEKLQQSTGAEVTQNWKKKKKTVCEANLIRSSLFKSAVLLVKQNVSVWFCILEHFDQGLSFGKFWGQVKCYDYIWRKNNDFSDQVEM